MSLSSATAQLGRADGDGGSWRGRARAPWLWALIGVALTIALRLPFLDAPLTRDEAGDNLIAQAFHHAGRFAYGNYFLDRPPLLLGLYGLASSAGGDTGVRIAGLLAAAALVTLIVALAVRLRGARAGPFAALAGAVMVSSQASSAVGTPAELLASVPSCASVLLLVAGLQRRRDGLWLFAAAGAAAACALLVKQSFSDASAAGVVALVVVYVRVRAERRQTARRAAAFLVGVVAMAALLAVWAIMVGATARQLWYAMFGFRLDALGPLAQGQPGARILRLVSPAVSSGLAVALVAAAAGFALLRAAPGVRPALTTWVAAAGAGIVLGGTYFPHYLIALMPAAAVGMAVACDRRPRLGAGALGLLLVLALLPNLRASIGDAADTYGRSAQTIGEYVHRRAEPGQTAYVLYARANALFYTGLPSPFPYHWALMMRTIPAATGQLRVLLAGARRPTWIIDQDGANGYGLDPHGATSRLLRRNYRVVARVCGTPILLARGSVARPAGGAKPLCGGEPAAVARRSPRRAAPPLRSVSLGRSARGRAIRAFVVGDPAASRRILVVGCIHGDERAGLAVTRALRRATPPTGTALWLVDRFNPDGCAAGTRQNAHGVDLNRNSPWRWRPVDRRGGAFWSGPRALSERESRAIGSFVRSRRPAVSVWYHQHAGLVDDSGGDRRIERRYARLVGLPFRRFGTFRGSITSWQNATFPLATAFVVELPPGRLSRDATARHARAVVALAAGLTPHP